MKGNLVFIGGIHGVGKGTLCRKLSDANGLIHLSASEVLKWSEIKKDVTDKKVESIPNTQERLISGLSEILESDKTYLLDGHYCLFDSNGKVIRVPMETFTTISPDIISVVVGNAQRISSQLQHRDKVTYKVSQLEMMQLEEIEYARIVSNHLDRPLIIVKDYNLKELSAQIKKLVQ